MDVKRYMKCFIYEVIYEMSHRCREVMGSNPVEVLTFSGFYTQLLKLRSQIAMIIAYLISNPQFNMRNISYITSHGRNNSQRSLFF